MNSTMIIGRIEEKEEAPKNNWVTWKILVAVNDEYSGKPICRLWCAGGDNIKGLSVGDWIVANGKLRDDWHKDQPALQIRSIQRIDGGVSQIEQEASVAEATPQRSEGPVSLGDILAQQRSQKPR